MVSTQQVPITNKMYGLLTTPQGAPIVRVPRVCKVSIGLPRGKDLHVWIDASGQWVVELGTYPQPARKRTPITKRFATMEQARKHYVESLATAVESPFPRKIPYFTFLKPAADGTFLHDFQAIAEHGPTPTEIRIVFLENEPLEAKYEWWKQSGLQCKGDGLNAQRLVKLATPKEKTLADAAVEAGERYYPIIDGCWTRGCPYAHKECKPKGRLSFQLESSPRLGGTAYFDTTSFRSIKNLYSCLEAFRQVTGRGDAAVAFVAGIPLYMVLAPYRVTRPDGKTSTQYAPRLEFRAEDAVALRQKLFQAGEAYRTALDAALAQLPAAAEPERTEAAEAAALTAEFYEIPEHDDDEAVADFEAVAASEESPEQVKPPQRKSARQEPKQEQQPAEVIEVQQMRGQTRQDFLQLDAKTRKQKFQELRRDFNEAFGAPSGDVQFDRIAQQFRQRKDQEAAWDAWAALVTEFERMQQDPAIGQQPDGTFVVKA